MSVIVVVDPLKSPPLLPPSDAWRALWFHLILCCVGNGLNNPPLHLNLNKLSTHCNAHDVDWERVPCKGMGAGGAWAAVGGRADVAHSCHSLSSHLT